jgi:hypothetical protein
MMRVLKVILISCFVGNSINSLGQLIKTDELLKASLKRHISALAHDSMQGRGTGTEGEQKASKYIIGEYKKSGLTSFPWLSDYKQSFTYLSHKRLGKGNEFHLKSGMIEGYFILGFNYWVLSTSGSATAFSSPVFVGYGISDSAQNYNDYRYVKDVEGKIFFIDIAYPNMDNPHSTFAKFDLASRVDEAIKRGAAGVVFINPSGKAEMPDTNLSVKTASRNIPVVYTTDDHVQLEWKMHKNPSFLLKTEVYTEQDTGYNVVGQLDFGQKDWVVIGAHYDHLGMGDQGGSLHAGHQKAIHNGADDNASGIAALLELASQIKNSKGPHLYNYIFTAFSGEELGLYGSSNFVKNMPVNKNHINYMINMDMLGRLDPSKNILQIFGTGTSPQWTILDSIHEGKLSIKKSASGIGPSDHTSFYKENIPVLHFFSGNHTDYHKPSDDESLINYKGEISIIKYIYKLIAAQEKLGKITFTKTTDIDSKSLPSYKVSLGIMPDYAFEGTGVRADAVTDGKPGAKAGLQKGDIIIQLGDYKTPDMMAYTKALANYSKGDTVEVTVLRDGKSVPLKVAF